MKRMLGLIVLIMAICTLAATPPQDYLTVGEKIKFNGKNYYLMWSGNPSVNYYKQEYLQENSTLEDYNEMITIDVLTGEVSLDKALQIKVAELTERKKSDPIVNFDLYKHDKQEKYFLDFVLTDGGDLYEWNLYQYVVSGAGSKKHLILTAYTYRDRITSREKMLQFFGRIKDTRSAMLEALDEVKLSEITFP